MQNVFSINSVNGTLLAQSHTHAYLLDHGSRKQSYFASAGELSKSSMVHLPRSAHDAAIRNYLINLIVGASLLFCIVENKGFLKLINFLDADYQVASCESLRTELVNECLSIRVRGRS